MRRTRALALPLARRLGIAPIAAPLWQERHFGAWEGRTWNAIYRATGNMMDGMIDDPHGFRPGETTGELITRVARALDQLPNRERIVLISHGGPIAAARLLHSGGAISQLAAQIIPQGSFAELAISNWLIIRLTGLVHSDCVPKPGSQAQLLTAVLQAVRASQFRTRARATAPC